VHFVWLIPAAPLAGAVILLLGGRRVGRSAGVLASAAVAVAFVASAVSWSSVIALPAGSRSRVVHLYQWAAFGSLHVSVDFRWDPLAAVMALTVAGVAFLIHVYSIGYMHGDERYPRFFAYMNLFVFSMLLLVLADNFVVLFAGWELVGLCSYLLIGFWFERPSAATAAKKAFITTRIGDTGMLIGIFLLFAKTGSLSIPVINRTVAEGGLTHGTATIAALLLFAGAVGKSAQIPLYVWLPDAMEGPTPVSALIHAATMVTAGVYLVVRLNVLYTFASHAGTVVAAIGAATALYAAILAMAEDDIKRVLAYSTISQLGFMFIAAGVGAYGAAIFHLVTHAFFKALLFLGAGSVMHGLGGETALDRMGGLRKAMPRTFAVMLVGWAAISGVPLFSGFFSKDAIIASAWSDGRIVIFGVAVAAASLTAFYMTRLVVLAFFGGPRWSEGVHPHESPNVMVLPMAGLALFAVAAGAFDLPEYLHVRGAGRLSRFLAPVIGTAHERSAIGIVLLLTAAAAGGALVAWWIYGIDLDRRMAVRRRLGPVNTLVRHKFFVDEIYATLIAAPARLGASFFAGVFDRRIVDGAVNGAATLVARASGSWRRVQSGFVRNYVIGILGGAALMVAYFVLRTGHG
jgi:NADH-quinone oxidoreductase subunit L